MTLREKTESEEVVEIFFGTPCQPCATEAPCGCGPHACICECGRCLWPYPLPDDGPLP